MRGLKELVVIVLVLLLGVALLGAYLPLKQASASPAEQISPARYQFNYSVKFVCGVSRGPVSEAGDFGEAPVKPGNYATEINIHNYNYLFRSDADTAGRVPVRKKLLVLVDDYDTPYRVREPRVTKPVAYDGVQLPPGGATMDDCAKLWKLAHPNAPSLPVQMPLFIGYLVLLSPVDLDVDVVYTAQTLQTSTTDNGTVTAIGAGISIDVERVPGKRIACIGPDCVRPVPEPTIVPTVTPGGG